MNVGKCDDKKISKCATKAVKSVLMMLTKALESKSGTAKTFTLSDMQCIKQFKLADDN